MKNQTSFDLADLTLADTTPLQGCLECLEDLKSSPIKKPETYLMHCGGLRGLNYLLALNPQKVMFFHPAELALDYMKLITELISICQSPTDFITRIYSRSIENFLQEPQLIQPFSQLTQQKDLLEYLNKNRFLNEYNQWSYLDRPAEIPIAENTLSLLSKEGKRRYESYIGPHQPGLVLFKHAGCRRLLPCWPLKEQIPFSVKNILAVNTFGELEPNTNVFYYGYGWLESDESFDNIKSKLSAAHLNFNEVDFFDHSFLGEGNDIVYCGSADTDFPELFSKKIITLKENINGRSSHVLTASGKHISLL